MGASHSEFTLPESDIVFTHNPIAIPFRQLTIEMLRYLVTKDPNLIIYLYNRNFQEVDVFMHCTTNHIGKKVVRSGSTFMSAGNNIAVYYNGKFNNIRELLIDLYNHAVATNPAAIQAINENHIRIHSNEYYIDHAYLAKKATNVIIATSSCVM